MNLRWLLFDYADPALSLSLRQRIKIQLRSVPIRELPKSLKRRRLWCGVVVVVPMIVTTLLMQYLAFQFIQFDQVGIWFFPALLFFLIPMNWIWISIIGGLFLQPEYCYRIRLEGYDVCLGCGYWLRGLDETIKLCPECGTERKAFSEDKQTKTESD